MDIQYKTPEQLDDVINSAKELEKIGKWSHLKNKDEDIYTSGNLTFIINGNTAELYQIELGEKNEVFCRQLIDGQRYIKLVTSKDGEIIKEIPPVTGCSTPKERELLDNANRKYAIERVNYINQINELPKDVAKISGYGLIIPSSKPE